MFVRFSSVIQTTIYWLYIRFSLKNFVSGSRHFSLILIYSFYWCTLHCISNRREIINEIERNSQWKKRRVYFCLFFSLFCWLTQKRIWRKRKKKKINWSGKENWRKQQRLFGPPRIWNIICVILLWRYSQRKKLFISGTDKVLW